MPRTRALALIGTTLLLAACAAEPILPTASSSVDRAARIVNGVPDEGAYPAIGALMFDWNEDGALTAADAGCSGTLIAPTVFLTAAHCAAAIPTGTPSFVSFDQQLSPAPLNVIAVEAIHVHPGYLSKSSGLAHYNDLAVFILPAGSTDGITPLQLPPIGFLDGLAARNGLRNTVFVNVGYGLTATASGRPTFAPTYERRVSRSPFMSISAVWLNLNMQTNATGLGGDCYGDSGSPKFLDGNPNMIFATVTTGDSPCRTLTKSWRLDTKDAHDFLGEYVTLP